jgi:hypothetical protein
MNSLIGLTPKALRKAADLQERIAALQEELEQLLGEVSAPTAEAPKKRKKFSAATKAKMRASQKARWAGIRGTAPEAKPEPQKKAKKKMSAKGLANIRAGVAKRMAKRAAKAKL